MAASKSKTNSAANTQDTPLIIEKLVKTRKPRKVKAKEDLPRAESFLEPSTSSKKLPAESAWSWKSLTDSATSNHPPIFTKDGSYFFSIAGSSVKILASDNGRLVSTLTASSSGSSLSQSQGHPNLITCAVLNPHNPFQLITGSRDGLIRVWDFLDAILLQTIDVEQPIFHMVAHENFKNHVFATVSRLTKKKNSNGNPIEDNGGVLKVSLNPTPDSAQSQIQTSSDILSIGKTRTPAGLAISPNGAWLVAIAGHKSYVIKTSDLRSGPTKFVSSDRLTCVTFHPTEEYFATGDSKGNVKLWYCLNDGAASAVSGVEKRAQTTSFHWHAHTVSSISFTPNGAYLLSGGEESVLVIWQLHTGKKEFVPRVGAAISSISIRPPGEREEEYLLGLSDATYTFVGSGSLKIARAFSRIKLDPNLSHPGSSTSYLPPLAVHQPTSNLILPSSHPSSLQVYSPSTSSILSEIEVSPSNRVSRKDDKPLEPSRVQKAAVSASGEWMATVDERHADESFRAEVYLKIWSWDPDSGFWILNTRIDRPHGLKKVTSIAFSPGKDASSLQFITIGEDEQIKSWRLKTTKGKNGMAEVFWVPRSSLSFRSQSPLHVSWSRDNSIIAIACGPYITLYDPVTNALRQVVTCSECKQVVFVEFLGNSGRYLAVVGKRDLVLWDLVAQSVRWHHRSAVNIDHLIAHPSEDNLALLQSPSTASSETKVLLFRPASAIPYQTHTIPFRLLNVIWYPSLAEPSKFSLVGITEAWNVILFGDEVHRLVEAGTLPTRIDATTQKGSGRTTIFQEMFGISSFASVERPSTSEPSSSSTFKGQVGAALLDVPAYLMPPLESLFEPLIHRFLQPRTSSLEKNLAPRVEDLDDEEVEMEVDGPAEQDPPFIAGARPQRVVDAREMNDFVELFRHHGLTSFKQQRSNLPRTTSNGVSKRNGVSKYPLNGVSTSPSHKINGKTPSTPQNTERLPDSSPLATVGKKRKKSLGETSQ